MKKAFTLIEILVVITIVAILTGSALPYVKEYVEETRQAKAKADLDEISRALVLCESREGNYKKNTVEDLTGRYLDRAPIDPWGMPYYVSTFSKMVYSLGSDRKGFEEGEEYAFDNIEVSYEPPLALIGAYWIDKNKSGSVDTQNVPDELHLTFSRQLASVDGVELVDETILSDLLSNIYIYRNPINKDSAEPISVLVDESLNNVPTYNLGDWNKNGLDMYDCLGIAVWFNTRPGEYNKLMDVNEDGVVNSADSLLLYNIYNNNHGTTPMIKDPDFIGKIKITSASHTIVLPLKSGAPLINGRYFIPGEAKIAIKENHNLIKDNSKPYQNACLSNQKVTIMKR